MKNKGYECEQFGISGIPGGFIEQPNVLTPQLLYLFNNISQWVFIRSEFHFWFKKQKNIKTNVNINNFKNGF